MGSFKDIIRGDGWFQYLQPFSNPVPILSSTGASPIVLLLQTVHKFATNDKVNVLNHRGNTGTEANNGNFTATVISPTSVSLQGSVGNGAGLNSGVIGKCLDGTNYTIICNIKKSEGDEDAAIAAPTFAWVQQNIFRFKLSLTATQTLALVAGTYKISVRWQLAGQDPYTFMPPEDINVLETPTSV